jgi:hypothetical protein
MQAITPVLRALSESGMYDLSIYAARESMPVIVDAGLSAILLDETSFKAEPASLLEQLIESERPDLLLTGSSPARGRPPETPEQHAIRLCHKIGIPSLSVMDCWGMYAERFSYNGSHAALDLVPDRLCVLDNLALQDLATLGIPIRRMVATHNPWLDQLAQRTNDISLSEFRQNDPGSLNIVLISQPLAAMKSVRNWTYDQFTLFAWLTSALTRVKSHKTIKLLVALHPTEASHTWQSLLETHSFPGIAIQLIRTISSEMLREANFVATSHSTLAYDALYFGTPCLSLRPDRSVLNDLWIDKLGLSRVVHDPDSLLEIINSSNELFDRNRMLSLKEEFRRKGVFFSDGNATKRVTGEIYNLLER